MTRSKSAGNEKGLIASTSATLEGHYAGGSRDGSGHWSMTMSHVAKIDAINLGQCRAPISLCFLLQPTIMDVSSPFLPPELERQLFETTADLYPESLPDLVLVCDRVHQW